MYDKFKYARSDQTLEIGRAWRVAPAIWGAGILLWIRREVGSSAILAG